MSKCAVCGRSLKDPKSVAAGMGSKCGSKSSGSAIHQYSPGLTDRLDNIKMPAKGKLAVLAEEERRFIEFPSSQSTYDGCKHCGSTDKDSRYSELSDGTFEEIETCADCGKDFKEDECCLQCHLPTNQCRCEHCEGCGELLDHCVCQEIIENARKKAAAVRPNKQEIKVGNWNGYESLVSKGNQRLTVFKNANGTYGVEPFALKGQEVPLLHTAASLGEAQQWAKEYLANAD